LHWIKIIMNGKVKTIIGSNESNITNYARNYNNNSNDEIIILILMIMMILIIPVNP
jgi:hypothetical protein